MFFAGCTGIYETLPRYQKIPHANSILLINKDGQVAIANSIDHVIAKRTYIEIDEADLTKLRTLRQALVEEMEHHEPKSYHITKDMCQELAPDNLLWDECGPAIQRSIYNKLLDQQGFALEPIHKTFEVNEKPFEIEYHRLGQNVAPHFSTTYKGWQSQNELPHDSIFYQFYKKWDVFHLGATLVNIY